MSRKGALEMAAMGARRQSWGISIWPIFMMEPGSGPGDPIYTGVAIQSPIRWSGTEPHEDEKQQLFDTFADRTSHHLMDLATRRVWQRRHPEWQKAYRLHGTGSTFARRVPPVIETIIAEPRGMPPRGRPNGSRG
jgi:hypothetical protein